VLIGAKNWAFDGDYEFIQVENTIVHPSYNGSSGYDLAALKLRRASRYPPRVIASDCVLDELVDGALVTIVGFGNTQTNGEGGTTQLNQVDTRIVDADCSENRIDGLLTGCDPNLRPGGELGAGGRLDMDGDGAPDGPRDSCFGDSGGPLYLHTERGVFLTGVTSRSFLGVSPDQPCRDGGIYVRPDALIDWIQNRTGTTLPAPQCNEAPQSSIAAARVRPGDSVVGAVVTDDPEGTSWSVELVEQPALGSVTVDGDRVTFTATPGAKGTDIVRFRVTDAGSPVWPRSAPASTEVVWEVSVGGGALACTSSGSAGGLGAWVGLVVLLLHGLGVRVRRS
jgi:hypothetical protein